jgi:rfaE bifunctional protein nucleotidyltransferase chain/domain
MKKVVLAHGVFDLLHFGHLAYFKEAKSHGDYLVVSVTTDRWVNKGPGRPYFNVAQRVAMLQSLAIVDEVIISDYPTAVEVINKVKPAVYVKGSDYKDLTKDLTGQIHKEKAAVESHGGELVFTDDIMFSSSTLLNKFFNNWTDEQKKTIELVKSLGGMNAIEKAFEEVSSLSVAVVGEPIWDVYRFVEPEGISSKSPTVSARFLYEERYQGGSLAIARASGFFAKSTSLCLPAERSIQKTRYISGSTRIFECTETPEAFWEGIDQEEYLDDFRLKSELSDVTIVADFGHGMFNRDFLDCLRGTTSFIALNVQTNSSNYGFNVFKKHSRYNYLCLDTREARLALHDRVSPPLDIAKNIKRQIENRDLSITLGSNGATFFTGSPDYEANIIHSPAFSDAVIDPIGAGDAYFLITSLLLRTDAPREIIPFIGNVYAGLKCKIIGNKESVSKANLLRACAALLK